MNCPNCDTEMKEIKQSFDGYAADYRCSDCGLQGPRAAIDAFDEATDRLKTVDEIIATVREVNIELLAEIEKLKSHEYVLTEATRLLREAQGNVLSYLDVTFWWGEGEIYLYDRHTKSSVEDAKTLAEGAERLQMKVQMHRAEKTQSHLPATDGKG